MSFRVTILVAVAALFVFSTVADAAPERAKKAKKSNSNTAKKERKKDGQRKRSKKQDDAEARKKRQRQAIVRRKFTDLDTNADNVLSLDEFIADLKGNQPTMAEAIFAKWDADGNESISRDEMTAVREKRKEARERRLKQVDKKKGGEKRKGDRKKRSGKKKQN